MTINLLGSLADVQSCQSVGQVDAKIDDLERHIIAVQALLVEFKKKHNELLPISRLPPEILCKAFLEVKDDYIRVAEEKFSKPWFRLPIASWCRLTHVCHHWRLVGIEHSPLWASIRGNVPDHVLTFHSRSKETLLDLEWMEPDRQGLDPHLGAIRRPLSQTSRIQSLNLGFLRLDTMLALVSSLSSSAPVLRNLSLSRSEYYRMSQEMPTRNWLLPQLFDAGAPHLQKLSLTACAIPWTSALFNHLTELELQDIPIRPDFPTTLFDLFRRSPRLIKAVIRPSAPEDRDVEEYVPPTVNTPIALPQLEYLELAGHVQMCCDTLAYLSVPENACVRAVFHYIGDAWVTTLPQFLPSRFEGIRSLRINPQGTEHIAVTPCRGLIDFAPPFDHHREDEFTFDDFRMCEEAAIFDTFSFGKVEAVHYKDDAHGYAGGFNTRVLLSLPSVKSVTLSGASQIATSFLQIFRGHLTRKIHGGAGDEPVITLDLLPSLQHLSFDSVILLRRGCKYWCSRHDPVRITLLSDVLRMRRELGAPIKSLRFYRGRNISQDLLDDLRAEDPLGPEGLQVLWDGIEEELLCYSPDCDCGLNKGQTSSDE
ncbi:hypothetical protein CC1G_04994 [Coprinopsis cinerea okayama7|uniref:Uncharacterized protein n=1 Tax=Coprinopsis cinerea (strain Okayama-7 / 130 / ATCC MYA-4618 / FGSC 9003) TaxID=240176 RepID=A8NSF6_COPC7|nr:hypothetical protein CC1G_04994 [Coprinopsis cinerea okayama7\|eukprot:XP_001836001.2 hypothetical protein CC1G_04994 [Coprinopsis cinerea okayama7\